MSGLPEGWTEHTSSRIGKIYYYNSTTEHSQWDKPPSPPAPIESKTKIGTKSPPEASEKGAGTSIPAPNNIEASPNNSRNASKLTILSPVDINAQFKNRNRNLLSKKTATQEQASKAKEDVSHTAPDSERKAAAQIGEIGAVTLNLKEEINEDPDLIVDYINYRRPDKTSTAHQVPLTAMQPTAKPGEKRKTASPDLPASTPKKSKPGPVQPKSACVVLNEYKPGLEYQIIERAGPAHDPCFKIKVVVDGNEFFGEGRTIKLGKQNAAEAALNSIVQFRNPLVAAVADPAPAPVPAAPHAPLVGDVKASDKTTSSTKTLEDEYEETAHEIERCLGMFLEMKKKKLDKIRESMKNN